MNVDANDMFYRDQVEAEGKRVARFKKIGYISSKEEIIIRENL